MIKSPVLLFKLNQIHQCIRNTKDKFDVFLQIQSEVRLVSNVLIKLKMAEIPFKDTLLFLYFIWGKITPLCALCPFMNAMLPW